MPAFEHTHSTRNPGVFMAALVGAGLLWLCWTQDGPLWIAGFFALVALVSLIAWFGNWTTVLRIGPSEFSFLHQGLSRRYPLEEIESLRICEWSDSTDYSLLLRSGETVSLPSGFFPSRKVLEAACARHGLAVVTA